MRLWAKCTQAPSATTTWIFILRRRCCFWDCTELQSRSSTPVPAGHLNNNPSKQLSWACPARWEVYVYKLGWVLVSDLHAEVMALVKEDHKRKMGTTWVTWLLWLLRGTQENFLFPVMDWPFYQIYGRCEALFLLSLNLKAPQLCPCCLRCMQDLC